MMIGERQEIVQDDPKQMVLFDEQQLEMINWTTGIVNQLMTLDFFSRLASKRYNHLASYRSYLVTTRSP